VNGLVAGFHAAFVAAVIVAVIAIVASFLLVREDELEQQLEPAVACA
jgi:predicted MFS family arabinose efflux permease